jgi:uncharacterized delta-60 repeat protein
LQPIKVRTRAVSRVLWPLLILALLLPAVILSPNVATAQSIFMAWEERHDGGGDDVALAVAVDSNDNVIVTGVSNGTYYTLKYAPNGTELWNRTFDWPGSDDEAQGIAVDSNDNIIVTGYSSITATGTYDYCTVKYAPNGTELWNRTYDGGGDDRGFAAAADSNNNVIVTGRSKDNYHTIKYAPNGTELWNRTFNGGGYDEATGVAVDPDDNIVVTGYAKNTTGSGTNDYYTIKYAPNGTELLNVTYDSGGNDCAQDVAVDSEGNIVVTGGCSFGGNTTWYYGTVKYHPDGTEFWTEPLTYHSPYTYRATGEAVGTGDGSRKEFMLGYRPVIAGSQSIYLGTALTTNYDIDYATGKITFYSPPGSGVAITATYTALPGATAFGVAVDSKDDIIITGRSYYLPWSVYAQPNIVVHPEISHYYYTIKYSPDGSEIWSKIYDRLYQECAYSVAVDSEDNVIVTGKVSDGETWNYVTIKYAELSLVSPNWGAQGQTLNVTITGTYLTAANTPDFGSGITVNSYTVNNATQITANISIAANATPGARDVTVTTPGGTTTLPDGFTVIAAPPTISCSPSSFSFTATQGWSNPPSQTLEIWNSGGGTLSWSVSDNAAWLSLSPASGNSTGEHDPVTVSVDTSGMSAGSYNATITISAPGATNTPQIAAVSLTINPFVAGISCPDPDVNITGQGITNDPANDPAHYDSTNMPPDVIWQDAKGFYVEAEGPNGTCQFFITFGTPVESGFTLYKLPDWIETPYAVVGSNTIQVQLDIVDGVLEPSFVLAKEAPPQGGELPVGAIVGIAIGGAAGAVLIFFAVRRWVWKTR